MSRFWLTPPYLYEQLDAEFHFDFDPCPHPRPPEFDGLACDWGQSSYINPPYRRGDALFGRGPTAFTRKAIAEQQQHGRSSVMLLPVPAYVTALVNAGAELRDMGRVPWLDIETKEPWSKPKPIMAFILRGNRGPM